MKKRVLSMLMALALCLTLLPTAALAEENTTEPSTQLTEPTPVPQEPKTPDQGENTETPDQPAVAWIFPPVPESLTVKDVLVLLRYSRPVSVQPFKSSV